MKKEEEEEDEKKIISPKTGRLSEIKWSAIHSKHTGRIPYGFLCVCVCAVFIMKRKTITWIGTACDFNDLGEYAKFSSSSHILRANSFHLTGEKKNNTKTMNILFIHRKCLLWLRLLHIHDN